MFFGEHALFTRKQNYKPLTKTTYKRCSIMRDDTIHYSHSIVAYVQPLHISEVITVSNDSDNNETENIEDVGHSSYQEE